MSTVLRAARVLLDETFVEACDVLIEGGQVRAIDAGLSGDEVLELPGLTLAPGFIDLHVHVLEGKGVIGADGPDLHGLGRALARRGVTSYLATSVTLPHVQLLQLVAAAREEESAPAADGAARCLGVHLEGPWISPAQMGAQPAEWIAPPSPAHLAELIATGPVRMVTLAPEVAGAHELIGQARGAGVVVSVGHSDATYAEVVEAVALGASHVTHCFNAMRGLQHREPGTAGAALDLPGLSVEVIADGVHVHPAMIRLIWRARGRESMCLVSDAVDLPGLAEADVARRPDGTLAGSVSALDHGVRTCVAAGIPLIDALIMASRTPALVLGRSDLGRITVGATADLVALDANLTPVATFVGGVRV